MLIVILEDDHLQFQNLERAIKEGFQHAGRAEPEVRRINNEYDFLRAVKDGEFRRRLPDVILLDVMVRWYDPAPPRETPAKPREYEDDEFAYRRAGIRCYRLFKTEVPDAPTMPLLISLLEAEDLESDLAAFEVRPTFLRKHEDQPGLIARLLTAESFAMHRRPK